MLDQNELDESQGKFELMIVALILDEFSIGVKG